MTTYKLLLLPGDGIGVEAMQEVEKIIAAFNDISVHKFETESDLVGGAAYDAHGVAITDATGPCKSVRVIGNDFRDISGANVFFSGTHVDAWVIGNTSDDASYTLVSGVTAINNVWGVRYDASITSDGLAVSPGYAFASERSLGFYRSGVSTLALSYGTVNLATNAVRLSMRPKAADSQNVQKCL